MDIFLKAAAVSLITVILGLVLVKQGKDFSMLLTLLACCMIAAAAVQYLEPVVDFFHELGELGNLDSDLLRIILKAVGIGLIGEIAGLVCSDAGNAALGKTLQMLASAVVLWMAIPLFQSLLDLVKTILGEI